MAETRKPLLVRFTAEERVMVEAMRAERGGRSESDLVRALVVEAAQLKPLKVPLAPRAEVEKLMAGAHPVMVVPPVTEADLRAGDPVLQVGPPKYKPGSLAKKGK